MHLHLHLPTSSVATSCYPSAPIDSSIGIEESLDVDSDPNELDTDTQGIRYVGRGGRPPHPRIMNKRKRNVRKKSIAWEHFTRDLKVLKKILWHIVIIVGLSINVKEKTMTPLTCTMSKHANNTRYY
jgi:hypothetical protein